MRKFFIAPFRFIDRLAPIAMLLFNILTIPPPIPISFQTIQHGDFFRYIQWHNLAVATTAKLDLPTYVLHYENYASDFEQTKTQLMDFLELDIVGEVPEFIPGKSYRNYFTEEQREAALELMRRLSNPETWQLLDRYDYNAEELRNPK